MIITFASALILGFAIAVPVGPASLLCMQRTLNLGRAAGLATGLGIAMADGLCAAMVAGGFGVAADFFVAQARWLSIGAGALLTGLGLRLLWAPPGTAAGTLSAVTQRWNTISGFLLTMANPMALLLMAAALTLFGFLEPEIGLRRAATLVAGIFAGSLLWWIVLVSGVGLSQRQIPLVVIVWLNRAAGLILVVLGIAALSHGFV